MKTVIVGGAVIRDGKILLVQEAQQKCYKQWNFPAGHLNDSESCVTGAARETKEETGIDVKPENLIMIYQPPNTEMLMFLFNMKILGGEISFDKSEILDVQWVPLDEVKKLDLRRGIRDLWDEFLRRYKSSENYSLNVINNQEELN